jgi:hypothetical protein
MPRKITTIAIAIAAFGIIGAGQIATSSISEAQVWEQRTFSAKRSPDGKSKMPSRSFEGFYDQDYCSFRREPWRKCTNDSNGVSHCHTAGWRTIDVCY